MVQAPVVQKILESGSNVDISDLDFHVDVVTGLVQIAVSKGCVLTVGKGYGAPSYEQWATIGGRNVAFRF